MRNERENREEYIYIYIYIYILFSVILQSNLSQKNILIKHNKCIFSIIISTIVLTKHFKITRSKNYKNYSSYQMNFVRNGIINSLMK
jgi:hypothetical protein